MKQSFGGWMDEEGEAMIGHFVVWFWTSSVFFPAFPLLILSRESMK
jgi:hypothetical protein